MSQSYNQSLPNSYRAVVFTDINKVELQEMSLPSPTSGEVLIQVELASICGSESRAIRGGKKGVNSTSITPGNTLGHEGVGTVVKTGSEVTEFENGDRVVILSHIPCYSCKSCENGTTNRCLNLHHVGFTKHGSAAEYVCLPAKAPTIYKIEKDLPVKFATLIEPISCVLHGILNLSPDQQYKYFTNKDVAIMGAGPIGIIWTLFAILGKANTITIVDPLKSCDELLAVIPVDYKDKVKSFGSFEEKDTQNDLDIVILANSDPSAYISALNHLRNNSELMSFAGLNGYTPQLLPDGEYSFDLTHEEQQTFNPRLLSEVHYKETHHKVMYGGKKIMIVGSSGYTKKDIETLLSLVNQDPAIIPIFEKIITSEFNLEDAAKIYSNFGNHTELPNGAYNPKYSIKISINPALR